MNQGRGQRPPEPWEIMFGQSPFAVDRRTTAGKLALGLSLVPWAMYGLMMVLQPG
jgi:hypothetical protein